MSNLLNKTAEVLKNRGIYSYRLSVKEDGKETETYDFRPCNRLNNVYSITKAYTLTAIGILITKGLLKTDDKVCDILSEYVPCGIDERWHEATVEDVIKFKTGVEYSYLDIDVHKASDYGHDFLYSMFKYKLLDSPGTKERYSDGEYYMLSRIVTKISGKSLDNFLRDELLNDMGLNEFAFSRCPMGYCLGGSGLFIENKDVIKLGQLYLDKGIYSGKRYLSEEFAENVYKKEYTFSYDKTRRIFSKGGMFGQELLIIPENRTIIAFQSFDEKGNDYEIKKDILNLF